MGPRVGAAASGSTDHELSADELRQLLPQHDEVLSQPAPARRFGSAAQIAAKLVGSYRSLAPVGGPSSSAQAPARPFNLAEALGLSGLISELSVRARRRRRVRGRRWRSVAMTLRGRRRGQPYPLQLDRLHRS
jgi:hypothetical protein